MKIIGVVHDIEYFRCGFSNDITDAADPRVDPSVRDQWNADTIGSDMAARAIFEGWYAD